MSVSPNSWLSDPVCKSLLPAPRIILSPVAHMAPPYFSTLSHKLNDCRVNIIEYKTCVSIYSTNFEPDISHYKRNSARYYCKLHRYSCKVPVILVRF